MAAYLARRLAGSALILIGISLVTFVLLYLLPADPARQIAGRSATAATVESIREQLGLNLPFYERYLRYVGSLLQGDLGRSYIQKTEVNTLIASRLPPSLLLMAAGIAAELRSEEHTSELQSLMRISYAVFCLKKKNYIIDL